MHKKRGPLKKDVRTEATALRGSTRERPMGVNAVSRMDDGNAFFPDPLDGPAQAGEPLAEELAEEFLDSATTAQECGEEMRDEVFAEELGGPFLEDRASMEFANDVDESNPEDAPREPFPTAMRGAR